MFQPLLDVFAQSTHLPQAPQKKPLKLGLNGTVMVWRILRAVVFTMS